MDERTALALEDSIKHWQENEAAKSLDGVSTEPEDCALCATFTDDLCWGCPVDDSTGDGCLGNKPYQDAVDADENNDLRGFKKAARAEVKFLEGLRE